MSHLSRSLAMAPGSSSVAPDCLLFAVALGGLGLIYAIYSLGFSFGLSFDDEPNLRVLASVVDLDSARLYVFGGSAGPLGRPLSLLSFLIDLPSWPDEPAAFMRTNALLHQINILLAIWFSYLVAPLIPVDGSWRTGFAVLAGLLWGASPLLLSSSLMVVQRMNLLSASFVLLGLIGFLKGVALLGRMRAAGLLVASIGLAGAIGLGILAKENAILLPAYALCIATCFLSPRQAMAAFPALPLWWRALFLYVPTVFVLVYLMRYWWLTEGVYPGRNYDVIQRLITESRILFQYLHMLLLPTRSGIGPYHDGYDLSEGLMSPPSGIIAVLAWLCMIVVALRGRRNRLGLLRFAVLWFVAGHLLESTVIGLELYFEHRNYLPSVGIWIALAGWVVTGGQAPLVRGAVVGIVASAQVLILFESARLWSDREAASAVWAHENPASQRALMFRSAEIAKRGDIAGVVSLVRDADPRLESQPDFLFHKLDVYCSFVSEAEVKAVVKRLQEQLRTKAAGHYSGMILSSIARRVDEGSCRGVTRDEIRGLFETMSAPIPRFSPTLRGFAHQYLLEYWVRERRLDEAMYHARERFQVAPSIPGAELLVDLLLSAELYDDARELMMWLELFVPHRPYIESYWLDNLGRMEGKIEAATMAHADRE